MLKGDHHSFWRAQRHCRSQVAEKPFGADVTSDESDLQAIAPNDDIITFAQDETKVEHKQQGRPLLRYHQQGAAFLRYLRP